MSLRLTAHTIGCSRGGREVLSGVSFSLGSGEALILTGPNGSGKSTLLRLIAGLVPLTGGALRLEGGREDEPVGAHCHYSGHQDALKPSLTVAENLAFWQQWFGAPAMSLDAALCRFEIAHIRDLPAAYLSAGQRRRLALARLLVSERPIWLLDEPTSALDERSEKNLTAILSDHVANGGLLIAATHLPLNIEGATVMRLADRPNASFVDEAIA